jgi:two-component system NtrC family sensor kinase
LLTSAPVYDGETLVGAMVIGTNLNTLVKGIKSVALADSLLLDRNGNLLSMTFVSLTEDSDDPGLTPSEVLNMNPTYSEEIKISGRDYQVYYTPMLLRNREVGVVAVALPAQYVVDTEATSRNSLSLVFTCATLSMIVIGYILAISILRPIKRLRDVSIAVASGNLDQQSGLKRRDEIGDLAQSFDSMTSQLRERTAELVQSEKLSAVGQLAAGIAHDVKNPLAIIKGMAEEMQEENQGNSDMIEYLQLIRDNADRANTIISDLMKFSRQSESEMQHLNIIDTLNSSVRLTEFMARKNNVAVEVVATQNRIMLNFDPTQIEQVLINLIQNAIQAMDAGGKITLRAGTIGPWAVLEVQDTGKGIPQENLQRIFDPFFTTKPVGEGTGLGLSVSYGIIKKHEGDIKVKSTIGVGTIFTIRLPLGENGS